MARHERLTYVADLLRGAESTTVDELSSRLRVSRRTILRDLATLRDRGLVISGEPGPGGGIRLEGDRGTRAVHFTLAEIVAIWLAATLAQAASQLPWEQAANSGLARLLGNLPAARSRALKAMCRRVIIGRPASARVRETAGAPPRELLKLFEEAFSAGVGLGFTYTDAAGRTTVRRVEPHGLLVEPPVWYILARDVGKGEPRAFRMDRVSRPRLLRDVAFRPDLAVLQPPGGADASRWRPLTGSWTS